MHDRHTAAAVEVMMGRPKFTQTMMIIIIKAEL